MLHPHFCEIVDHIETQKIGMLMETNGTMINDKMASYLKSKKFFNFISVSVDGANAETHDFLRGTKGAYDKAIAGIKALVKAGFHPQIICTLHRGNAAEIEDVIKLAESLRCGSVKFNHVQQMGRGDNFNESHGLSIPELLSIFSKIEKIIKPKYKFPVFFDIPMAFFPIKKLLKDSICRCAVHGILGILSNGETALCGVGTTIPELTFGHIETNAIKNIWVNNKCLIDLRQKIPNQLEGICSICLHRDICLGSCIANNFHLSKKINSEFNFCAQAEKSDLFPASRKNIREV
jgi:SynChlorMet cassette radical SAM/SPASM protein ScmF